MQYHIQTLVKHLFDKDSFEQVTVQELKQFTEAYPYAAVGQFLYAKKLYEARSWNYYEQIEQANLYFHNPLWFRWLMDQKQETPVLQRQEELAQQSAWRVVVQMPKGGTAVDDDTQPEEKETVQETITAENHNGAMAATASPDPETQIHEFVPGIEKEEPIQAATEAFGFIQQPAAGQYTEEVTDNTGAEPQPLETAEEIETQLHEFVPELDTEEPLQAATEEPGFVQEPGTSAEQYTEAVTDNTSSEPQPLETGAIETPVYTEEHEYKPETDTEPVAEETASAIETIADIPAAKEETETIPEFFAEAAAAEEEKLTSAVAIAENSLLAEEQTLEQTLAAAATRVSQEASELEAASKIAEIAGTTPEVPEAPAAIEAEEAAASEPVPAASETPADQEALTEQELSSTTETPAAYDEPSVAEPPVSMEAPETSETFDITEAVYGPATHEEPAAQTETGEVLTVPDEPGITETLADIHMQASGFAIQPEERTEEPADHEPEVSQSVPKEPLFNIPVTQEPSGQQWKAEPVFTPASKEPKTTIDTEEPIFESYHTIDYFASQGIKLQQEDYKDRLGKQLKSFTEWLRSMKRIVPTEANASLDEVTNRSIQRIAEHSVEEKEVITEAMAEVWAKQGHRDKAISVYEKLSLLNPAKSPYFAGRIEQLKAT